MTRSQQEICDHIEEVKERDFFGFRREVLIASLDFDHATPYLKEGATREEWDAIRFDAQTDALEYYVFVLGKIRNHRGLSAARGVEKLEEYAWLLGRDDAVAASQAADYTNYGAPKVRALVEVLGAPFAWPDGDRRLDRMSVGEPCRPHCDEGCGL